MTEHQLQAMCVLWFWNHYVKHRRMLLCIDNNSYNRVEGNKKKALGVVSGASDMLLIGDNIVVFIEFKVKDGVMSDKQKDFRDKLVERGHVYVIVRTFEGFKEVVCKTIGQY